VNSSHNRGEGFSRMPLQVVAKRSVLVSRSGAGLFLGIGVDRTQVGVAEFLME
jgi:hypothetical protein